MDLSRVLLAHLGGPPTQAGRFIRLHTPLGPDVLLAERIEVDEAIGPQHGAGLRIVVDALALDVHLDVERLLGQPALLELLTQQSRSDLRPWHGHVTRAELVGSDGGLARFRLVIEPWLAFLGHRQDAWVFQDRTVPEIVDEVFAGWAGQGRLAPAWRWELADASVYSRRSLCTQYHETDLDFVQRLLREEGLFGWFEHRGDPAAAALGRHTLVIADHSGAFTPGRQAVVRYTQSHVGLAEDGITRWRTSAHLRSASLAVLSPDYRAPGPRRVAQHGVPADTGAPFDDLVQSDVPGAYAFETRAQGERLALRQMQAIDALRSRVEATSSVRSTAPGTTFLLSDHPVHDGTDPLRDRFVVLGAVHTARNNLSADLRARVEALSARLRRGSAARREAAADADEPLYRCRLQAQRAAVPVRIAATDRDGQPDPRLHVKPTVHGVQTALVVGAAGSDVHTDRDHRIKLQFHWQRGARGSHRLDAPGGDNAPANDASGTWVRVAESIAGANWGSNFTPRAGQEVLVGFIEGDIDRPVVVGSVYNGRGRPDAAGNAVAGGAAGASGNAPAWFPGGAGAAPGRGHGAVLTGFKSQELGHGRSGSGGHNRLVFDDSPGAGRIEVASTRAQTRLQLGHLLDQNDHQRLGARGQGLDLATAAWGAVRAAGGLLVSAHGRPGSQSAGHQLDSREPSARLAASTDLVRALGDASRRRGAETGERPAGPSPVERGLHETAANLAGTAPGGVAAWTRPDLVIAAPAGIASRSPAAAVYSAAGTVALVAGSDVQQLTGANQATAAKEGLVFCAEGRAPAGDGPGREAGLRLHAASGSVLLQSRRGAGAVTADRRVEVTSTAGVVRIVSPVGVLLTAAGAGLDVQTGGIALKGPGKVEFRAAMKNLTGPSTARVAFQNRAGPGDLPGIPFDERFQVVNDAGAPIAHRRYRITREDGGVLGGVTDADGRIEAQHSFHGERVRIALLARG